MLKTSLHDYDKKPRNFQTDKLISPIESSTNAAREDLKPGLGDVDKTPQEMYRHQMKSSLNIGGSNYESINKD